MTDRLEALWLRIIQFAVDRLNIQPAEQPNEVHVIPRNDLVEHDDSDDCVCSPSSIPAKRSDGSVGWVVAHRAFDGRD